MSNESLKEVLQQDLAVVEQQFSRVNQARQQLKAEVDRLRAEDERADTEQKKLAGEHRLIIRQGHRLGLWDEHGQPLKEAGREIPPKASPAPPPPPDVMPAEA